jgi:hypothetical protein
VDRINATHTQLFISGLATFSKFCEAAAKKKDAEQRITSILIASYCARRISEGRLKSEDITSPLNRVFRLFVPAEPLTAIWRTLWRTKNDI